MSTDTTSTRGYSRRRLLTSLGVLTVAGATTGVLRAGATEAEVPPEVVGRRPPGFEPTPWHDPASWPDRRVPGPGDIAVVVRPVMLTGIARVAGVRIEAGGVLIYRPTSNVTLESTGNVVVAGQLVMRPALPSAEHVLRFTGIDESRFVGGGHHPIDSDVGLWVVGDGLLDAVGAAKRGWTRLTHDALAGQTVITVEDAAGWLPGDELTVVPTVDPVTNPKDFHAQWDHVRVVSVNDSQVTLDRPLRWDHPSLRHPQGNAPLFAEVANLSRNVRIEGTPEGHAHVQLSHTQKQQFVKHIAIRHVGPRRRNGEIIMGRYGFHMHMANDASRGSLIEGVVIRDCGNRAFVPHASHGVTFYDCVSLNTAEESYWWDDDSRATYPLHATFDVTYEHCAGLLVAPREWGSGQGHTHTAFQLEAGEGNRCIDCVAVGVRAGKNASGFHWPSDANLKPNVWEFSDCVAHNNGHGIFVWQNGSEGPHQIDRFVAYRNSKTGINHGAYSNHYLYRDILLAANGSAAMESHAVARIQQAWREVTFGEADYSIWINSHSAQSDDERGGPTLLEDCRLDGARITPVLVREGNKNGAWYDLVRCTVDGRTVRPQDFVVEHMHADSRIRVQNADGSSFQLTASGVRTIDPFHRDA
jgi:hypothetical protein